MSSRRALAAVLVAALVGGAPAYAQDPSELPPLSTTPQGTTTTAPQPTPEPPTTPEPAQQLPNTGADVQTITLLGLVVLLAGIGLRLRSAPERF